MHTGEDIDLVARHILGVEPKVVDTKRFIEPEGLFNPFESMVADSYVLHYIRKNWNKEQLEEFVKCYGSLQETRLREKLSSINTYKLPIQREGDYSIAALASIGIII